MRGLLQLEDRRDVQFGNNQAAVVRWALLTPRQQTVFLRAVRTGARALLTSSLDLEGGDADNADTGGAGGGDAVRDDALLDLLVVRRGEFDKAVPQGDRPLLRREMVESFKDGWRQYVEDQLRPEVYGRRKGGDGGGGGDCGGDHAAGGASDGGGGDDDDDDDDERHLPAFKPKRFEAANFSLAEALALCRRLSQSNQH
jgi:hypothetical protein